MIGITNSQSPEKWGYFGGWKYGDNVSAASVLAKISADKKTVVFWIFLAVNANLASGETIVTLPDSYAASGQFGYLATFSNGNGALQAIPVYLNTNKFQMGWAYTGKSGTTHLYMQGTIPLA